MERHTVISTLPDGKICDFIDGAIRSNTAEEYVRQNIERRLVRELGYKPERIGIEFIIKVASSKKRVDIAIFPEGKRHAQENIAAQHPVLRFPRQLETDCYLAGRACGLRWTDAVRS